MKSIRVHQFGGPEVLTLEDAPDPKPGASEVVVRVRAAGVNPVVCALIATIVVDSVILYPVQTASNLIAYESGYFRARDVGRLGLAMLGLTIVVGLGIAVPYWSVLGLPLMTR